MMRLARIVRRQWLGGLALISAVTGTTFAATGQFARLGALNTADKPTVIQNTGAGTALDLRVQAGQIPLRVNSSVAVPRLNAALLSGKPARKFAPASGSTVYAPATGSPNYAPATGSPNYVASDAAQVLLSETAEGSSMTGGALLDSFVVAPANGVVTVLFAGTCDAGAEPIDVLVSVGGTSLAALNSVAGEDFIGSSCAVALSTPVASGDSVTIGVDWFNTNVNLGTVSGYVLVAFNPASGGS